MSKDGLVQIRKSRIRQSNKKLMKGLAKDYKQLKPIRNAFKQVAGEVIMAGVKCSNEILNTTVNTAVEIMDTVVTGRTNSKSRKKK